MNRSFKLFSVAGIDVRVHLTFPLILVWAAFQFGILTGGGLSGALFGIIVVLLLFGIVTLHELGHSFAAMYYKIPVKDIVLLPIGGVAQLKRMPKEPWQEFVVALAGPAVNVVLALLLGGVALALNVPVLGGSLGVINGTASLSLTAVLSYIFVSNLPLALFNLIPAFPMDGGRVLRALLAMGLPYARATAIAARLGQVLAVGLGIYGLFNGGIFLMFIAFFVYNGAKQENALVQQEAQLQQVTVGQVFARQVQSLRPFNTLQDALTLKSLTGQTSFPVHDGFRYVGLLTGAQLQEGLQRFSGWTAVNDLVRRDLPVVTPGDSLERVQSLLQQHQTEALPVVDDHTFLGVITLNHLREAYQRLVLERRITIQPA